LNTSEEAQPDSILGASFVVFLIFYGLLGKNLVSYGVLWNNSLPITLWHMTSYTTMRESLIPADLTHRLKVERKRLGKSQGEMADMCGSSREMWGRYERGTYPISEGVLRAFIDCGADATYLSTGTRATTVPKPPLARAVPEAQQSTITLPAATVVDIGAANANTPNNGMSAQAVDMAFQVLHAALTGGQHAGQADGGTLLRVSPAEHELVMAYRQASLDRKEVFHDLVFAQKRRAAL
jgi:transcriptional regulator with XRE-family HTH domain